MEDNEGNGDLESHEPLGLGMTVEELQKELRKQKLLLKKVKDEAEAELREKDAALEEQKRKFSSVISRLKEGGEALKQETLKPVKSVVAKPLDQDTPGVEKVGANVLSKITTTNTCSFGVTIHEEPAMFLEALVGDQAKVVGKMLFQKVVEEDVVYWSFTIGNNRPCELLLRMRVERRQNEDEIIIRISSVDEEELGPTSLPNPHSTATKKLRLLLQEGTIILRPLPFGQTSFSFTAQVDVREVTGDASPAGTTIGKTTSGNARQTTVQVIRKKNVAVKMLGSSSEAGKTSSLFCNLAEMFYERFKKEDIIDERRKADFIENGIPNAPPLTEAEENLIAKSMGQVDEMKAKATRVAGGAIPTWVVDKKIPQSLKAVQEAINEFRQDDKIDAADREDFSTPMMVRWMEENYSEEELLLIDRGRSNMATIKGSSSLKGFKSRDPCHGRSASWRP
ncbi:hypothetical protein TrVE_jg14395 [Triparma verrucosa]|uniref:Uncharacterized protein n=1 Tax=Triparma verrucosa TaxID=1606542 RepID=A0A9W7BSG5_9STRA|nr:hypothetical protein TrVE_jg14395 [Triparma verrucosa]